MSDISLTIEEQKIIASLQRLANKWPDSLQLFSWSGALVIIKEDANGAKYDVGGITGIPNDGGDPRDVEQAADINYE